jgi:hypothetical protein
LSLVFKKSLCIATPSKKIFIYYRISVSFQNNNFGALPLPLRHASALNRLRTRLPGNLEWRENHLQII